MAPSPTKFPTQEIWSRLDPAVPFKGDWRQFRHRQQGEFLQELVKYATFDLGLSHIGESEEGRTLHTLRFGRGKRRVMLWARQHGDESDCTAGLAMVLHELILRCDEPPYALILDKLELGVFPMVNPDGVARFTRRNAQGIDINRDAVARATPEGRAILAVAKSFNPEYCFNLHDMNPRKSCEGKNLVAIAFQAGPFEQRDIDNPVRLKAKKICGIMAEEARPFAPENIARYTADYMHRAFGDSMMRMGVSSILIEAGGWREEDGGDDFVRKIFALTLLRGLHAIAAGEDADAESHSYDVLPFDSGARFADILLEGGIILNGTGASPFRGDVSMNAIPNVGRAHEPIREEGTIENIGDLEDDLAKNRFSIEGKVVMPGFIAAAPDLKLDEESAMQLLGAGISTVACGFGPFRDDKAREEWLQHACMNPPPLHVIAFERAADLGEIRRRHGLTELAGFLVGNLEMTAADLATFIHMRLPVQDFRLGPHGLDTVFGVDVFLVSAASPTDTILLLHVTLEHAQGGRKRVGADELRVFADEFLRGDGQIGFSIDPRETPPAWLPFLSGRAGLSHSRAATPEFFSEWLRLHRAEDAAAVTDAAALLMLPTARAFRLGNVGRIECEQRADLVAFDESVFRGKAVTPVMVILNGRIVYEEARRVAKTGHGAWHLAAKA
ncbi:hypothetical protein BH09SUM1_BH09SUM1_24130 [soil metagenome]